mgnify:CR=1 FL=1
MIKTRLSGPFVKEGKIEEEVRPSEQEGVLKGVAPYSSPSRVPAGNIVALKCWEKGGVTPKD